MKDAKIVMTATLIAAVACAAVERDASAATEERIPATMTRYRDALLTQIDRLESALPEITKSAGVSAGRVIGGGDLYAAGQEAFVIEAYVRAGGLMMIEMMKDKTALSSSDTVWVGATTNDDAVALASCRRAKDAGAYVVLFSPAFAGPNAPLARLCDDHIVNFAEPAAEKEAGPLSSLFNVTALWTYTAEFIGAATRRGLMPVMWQSVLVPGTRARNARYHVKDEPLKRRFHSDMAVPSQAEAVMGRAYLDVLRRQVRGLRGYALNSIADAAALMAESVRSGGAVYVKTVSHFAMYEVRSPAIPAWMKTSCESVKAADLPKTLTQAMKPKDVYFEAGYYELNVPCVEAARAAGGKSVIALCHAPVALLTPAPDILIDAQWQYGDGALTLPGYDVPMLPTSGVLQMAVLWTTVGRVNALLAGGR